MEYFTGSILTLLTVFVLNKIISNNYKKFQTKKILVTYSQSYVFETIKPFISSLFEIIKQPKTQASKYSDEKRVRILFLENKAYWIEKNQLLEASLFESGEIDYSSAIEVDTITMDDVQLKRTMFIVEQLREGLNDDLGYPGDTKF